MDETLRLILRAIRIAAVVLLLGVLINDGVRVASTFKTVSDGLTASMNAALGSVRAVPQDTAAAQTAAASAATAKGAVLEAYQQETATAGASNHVKVTLTVSAPLNRTVIAGPALGLFTKVPSVDWYTTDAVKIRLHNTKQVDDFGGTQ